MPASLLLLRVAATWPLPGLGLLALPDGNTPNLLHHPLHAVLSIRAAVSGGSSYLGTATVEEVTRPDMPEKPTRGLLLTFDATVTLPPGTEIWLNEAIIEVF